MKKIMMFIFVLALCFALPGFAQDDMEAAQNMGMAPPPAIDNSYLKSMVGDWAGSIESAMGKSEDKFSCQLGLNGQFLILQVESKMPQGGYTGRGAVTLDQDGNLKGYWIDNFRSMAQGTGMIEGNKLTMTWKSDQWTYTRVEEKIDDNTISITGKMEMADGTVSEEKGTYKRTNTMTDKM